MNPSSIRCPLPHSNRKIVSRSLFLAPFFPAANPRGILHSKQGPPSAPCPSHPWAESALLNFREFFFSRLSVFFFFFFCPTPRFDPSFAVISPPLFFFHCFWFGKHFTGDPATSIFSFSPFLGQFVPSLQGPLRRGCAFFPSTAVDTAPPASCFPCGSNARKFFSFARLPYFYFLPLSGGFGPM